ncbi:unnamed protein product, partial [Mesorhabditis spiculigera]
MARFMGVPFCCELISLTDEFWSIRAEAAGSASRAKEEAPPHLHELVAPCTSPSNRICEDCGVVDMDVPDFSAVEAKPRIQYKKTFSLKHVIDRDALDNEVDDELLEIIPERVQKPKPKDEFVESEDDLSDQLTMNCLITMCSQEAVKDIDSRA